MPCPLLRPLPLGPVTRRTQWRPLDRWTALIRRVSLVAEVGDVVRCFGLHFITITAQFLVCLHALPGADGQVLEWSPAVH